MSSAPTRIEVDVEVRYAETDQMGLVHHATFLVWFELARTRLCLETGTPYTEIEAGGHFLTVIRAGLDYRQGARYGDTVQVAAWVKSMASRRIVFGYVVRIGDQLLATGTTEHLWVSRQTGRACRMPEHLRAPFARLAGSGAPPASRSVVENSSWESD